jgi:large subunit ribosomal protein L13
MSTKRKIHEIDATGAAPGRIASMAAALLIGKHKAAFTPHLDLGDKVLVKNAAKAVFTGKKLDQKEYKHHSMHPGGLKAIPAKKVMVEKPEEIIRHAVSKMLPRNKHRETRLKRLSFN